jgi:hypothetical protein
MPLKRQIAIPIIFFLLFILTGVGLLFLTSYLLPDFLESKIVSILKKDGAITDLALDFHELDLDGANLGSVRIGTPQNPALIIRSIHIDYSPAEIYQKKIKKISANGVELYCELKNGRFGLRGFDLEKFLAQLDSARTKKKASDDQQYPSFPQWIEINNGTLICILNEKTYRLPFEMNLVQEENNAHNLKANVRLYPRGQAVHISTHIDLEQNRIESQFTAKELDLLRFADIFKPANGLNIAGLASLEANADMQLTPFAVSSIAGRLKGSAINVSYKNLEFQNRSNDPDNEAPLIIDFEGPDQGKWNIKLSEFTTIAPIAARVFDMAATIQPSQDGYTILGNLNIALGTSASSTNPFVPLRFKEPFDLPAEFTGIFTKIGKWQFNLTSRAPRQQVAKGASFDYDQIHFTTKFPSVHLEANGIEGQISAAYKLRVADVHISSEVVDILVPEFVFKGKTNLPRNKAKNLKSTFDLDLSGMAMTLNSTNIKLDNLSVGGKLQRDKAGAQGITAMVKLANTDIETARGDIKLKLAQGTLPLRFPAGDLKQKGSVSISDARYQNLNLGTIEAELQQTTSGISFSGNLKNHLVPQLAAKFAGKSTFGNNKDYEIRAQFEIFYPQSAPEINLGRFLPAASGFTFEGKFLERGNFVVGKKGLLATAESSLSNGILRHRKNKIMAEGIQMTLLIPDLPKMRSAPGQKLQFTRASIGDMNIENGDIDFQIESARSLLIEKSHFNWCDGKIDAPAIRLKSGLKDYSLILYCDRLNLAKVLEQFGAASVEAEGELNGRIPLQYKNGQLSFQDGFLFTTPGDPGKIRMTDTDILTAGIPQDTPQYVQMELARKALEDYDYKWAKLNLTTEGDDLLLNMQLDGKPAKSLPFVYRKDMGGFAKVEAGVQGSTFQGIRLDVNFRLPLNKIMQYKELIQIIQKNRE